VQKFAAASQISLDICVGGRGAMQLHWTPGDQAVSRHCFTSSDFLQATLFICGKVENKQRLYQTDGIHIFKWRLNFCHQM
jgi:hypothetical protein